MSPVGGAGRFGEGGPKSRQMGSGAGYVWTCVSCGEKNEGRPLEQGCGFCGVGDPTKAPPAPAADRGAATGEPLRSPADPPSARSVSQRSGARREPETGLKIYRLLEYTFATEQAMRETLQRSLVGQVHLGHVSITGCIVDDVSLLQEDRLRMARLQPGVWLSGPKQTEPMDHPSIEEFGKDPVVPQPPRPTALSLDLTQALRPLPLAFLRTLFLGLSSVVAELPTTPSTEYLTRAEAESLIYWLESILPAEETEAPPDRTPEEQQRLNQITAGMGAQPTATTDETLDQAALDHYNSLRARKDV